MLNFIDLISHKKLILNLNKYKSLEEQLKFLNNNLLKYQKIFIQKLFYRFLTYQNQKK